jgi:hypothetical protein
MADVTPTARDAGSLRTQFAEELLFVHAILKSLPAVNEDHWNLIVIEASDFGVGVHVDFTPAKAAPLVQLDDALLDDFAEMTPLAGINDDFTRRRHSKKCSSFGAGFPRHGWRSMGLGHWGSQRK